MNNYIILVNVILIINVINLSYKKYVGITNYLKQKLMIKICDIA